MTKTFRPFHTVLVANRGEIACRIMRTARTMGLRTVAVYSDADVEMPHVAMADTAVRIGPPPAARSYLDIHAIIEAAKATGADAVHPGYGFLSENEALAGACEVAGLVFVGPSASAIKVMGNKAEAKRRMASAGVLCVPGYQGEDQTDQRLIAESARIGYPVMVKAAAGGGGKGMRFVAGEADLAPALMAARSEAERAFGSSELILEKAVLEARHVEVQVFGDSLGNIIHLFERDCSVQRRHQKVIEEAPSPAVGARLRMAMGEAAIAAARTVSYVGAGTIEFLLSPNEEFYFLEMNTRLQVEHPVTESVTGLDLVEWQLIVASGQPLPCSSSELKLEGHSIEARLYAEDPAHGFLPQSGFIRRWQSPSIEGVRIDAGIGTGVKITPDYDPLLAKIISRGRDREEARRRLVQALQELTCLGVSTNRAFLIDCLSRDAFTQGKAATSFIGQEFPDGWRRPKPVWESVALAAIVPAISSGCREYHGWRSRGAGRPVLLRYENNPVDGLLFSARDHHILQMGGVQHRFEVLRAEGSHIGFLADGSTGTAEVFNDGDTIWVQHLGQDNYFVDERVLSASQHSDTQDGELLSPIAGTITDIKVEPGTSIARGAHLMTVESMKMQFQIEAPIGGIVTELNAAIGENVPARKLLVRIEPREPDNQPNTTSP